MLHVEMPLADYTILLDYIPPHSEGAASFQMSVRFSPEVKSPGGAWVSQDEDYHLSYLGAWPTHENTILTLDCFAGQTGAVPLLHARRKQLRLIEKRTDRQAFYLAAIDDLLAAFDAVPA